MNTKALAVIIAILGAVSVMYTQHQAKPELSFFESWKSEFGV